jgi:hypothetical protein
MTMFTVMIAIVPIITAAIFIAVIAVFVYQANKLARERRTIPRNAPVLTMSARVISRRSAVVEQNHTRHVDDLDLGRAYRDGCTTYYVTFETSSGDDMELTVSDYEYGQLREGDIGKLTVQGTRYVSFERTHES